MKILNFLKTKKIGRVALFYFFFFFLQISLMSALIETTGFLDSFLHSVCCDLRYHIDSGKLHCILVKKKSEYKKQITSQY